MTYLEFKEQNNKKLNDFIGKHFVFAFGREQYERKLKELGLTDAEFQAKYVGFLGGAIPADKVTEFQEISKKAKQNLRNKMIDDYDFAKEAFRYEMSNFECFISGRYDEVFGSLCVSRKDLAEYKKLGDAFVDAKHDYWQWGLENY